METVIDWLTGRTWFTPKKEPLSLILSDIVDDKKICNIIT